MASLRNVARWMMVMATTPVRNVDLVVPLALDATAMRTAETAGLVAQCRSGAVFLLSNRDARQGDVDSTNNRSTLPTLTMPGTRTSTMATRTTTTRTTSSEPVPSAAQPVRHHADFSSCLCDERAYEDCTCYEDYLVQLEKLKRECKTGCLSSSRRKS